jgi:hypothetical protein
VTIPTDAIIAPSKLTQYLLARQRTNDKSGYLAQAGFGPDSAAALESEIRRLSASTEAVADRVNEYGTYYTVTGAVTGPNARQLQVRLVWLRRLDGVFSFVTLVPESRSTP